MSATNALDQWFTTAVLPCERALTRLLRRYVADQAELVDLRQDVYLRLYEAAAAGGALPDNILALAQVIARNLLIDRSRRRKVIAIDLAAELDFDIETDLLTPERIAAGRDDWQRFERGLKRLPNRCRQVVTLRKVEGLSQRECAARMGISEDTVERQVRQGMRALADFMLGGEGRIERGPSRRVRVFGR